MFFEVLGNGIESIIEASNVLFISVRQWTDGVGQFWYQLVVYEIACGHGSSPSNFQGSAGAIAERRADVQHVMDSPPKSAPSSPVEQGERVAELPDPLEMDGIAGDQLQTVIDGNGGNHRVSHADRQARPVEVAGDAARKFGGLLVQGKDFFGGNGNQEPLQPLGALFLLEASHDLHDCDNRKGVLTERLPVSRCVAGDVRVNPLADFREDVGIEQ